MDITEVPLIYFYSFFKPKTFITKLITENLKIPIYIFFIGFMFLLIALTCLSLLYGTVAKGLSEFAIASSFLNIIAPIGMLIYTIVFNYLLQTSFRKNEFQGLKTSYNSDLTKWYIEGGFLQVMFAQSIHVFLPQIIQMFESKAEEAPFYVSILFFIFLTYSIFVDFITVKVLFHKEGLFDTIAWYSWNRTIAFIITIVSLFGILLIPFIFFKRKELKDFYN